VPDATAPVELLRGLAVLAEPPEEGHRAIAEAIGLPATPTPAEYSDLFLFQLYPYASVHLGPEGMLGGEALGRIAGYWVALGYEAPAEPDHLAALLGLHASLAERAAELGGAERALIDEARGALMNEHVSPWVFPFLDRARELAPPTYRAWAELLHDVLRREIEERRAAQELALSAHLRLAPPLVDPREEGADAFLQALLAPVRSGIIVTRADLARISADADLALRAGERRYALEHLLAQSAAEVLHALAAEAVRQGAAHAARRPWLGPPAGFLAGRCDATAKLLRALAEEPGLRDGPLAPVESGPARAP
jgi:TorA maturation chaperone TorD